MKRFHVHLSVKDLSESIRFYSALFGAEPSVRKDDYAKWMLDDPRINFAISHRSSVVGLDHMGFQVESDAELSKLRAQVSRTDLDAKDEKGANCCYVHSDKYWVEDPQGIAWETFHSLADIPLFGKDRITNQDTARETEGACCIPAANDAIPEAQGACCAPAGKSDAEKSACCR